MFSEFGCHGRILTGGLPPDVGRRLEALTGDWLEFDRDLGAIVVRHVQPTTAPVLPTVVSELVHMLAAIPFERLDDLEGGEFLVHTDEVGRLVRITVAKGGALHVEWAHPDYAGSEKRPYDGRQIEIEGYEQRLNGAVTFGADDPAAAAARLQGLADTFEGLFPEGDFRAAADADGRTVRVTIREVNLDARVLVQELTAVAQPRSLSGRIAVSSFQDAVPEHMVRLVFERGEIWVQRPLLWSANS